MAEITLSKGFIATVDDVDYRRVAEFKWTALVGKNGRVYGYRRTDWNNAKRRWGGCILLHRFITDAPVGMDVDHVDSNGLNNSRANLRVASRSQNLANSRRAIGAAGYRGVTIDKRDGGISAQCAGNLGRFPTIEAAARAYDARAFELWGEFARLNFPNSAQRGLVSPST